MRKTFSTLGPVFIEKYTFTLLAFQQSTDECTCTLTATTTESDGRQKRHVKTMGGGKRAYEWGGNLTIRQS
jgi:hypothetical protein